MSTVPVVDCHHHIWRLSDLPWLSGEIVPRIFGPYEPIQRDYLIDEYRAEAQAAGVTKSVYVQVNWPVDQSVEEVRWVNEVAEATGWPHAIIGSADMFDPSCGAVFEEQAQLSSLVRGTRLQLHWHERDLYRFASAPDRMNDPVFRQNLKLLPRLGWLFELQVFSSQMVEAARLVGEHPDTTFVLVHAGMLESTEPEAVDRWATGMAALAEHDNVVVKLTGLGTFVRTVDATLISMIIERCLEWFGPDRCMWGSNFPVEKLWTEYGPLLKTYRSSLSAYSLDTQAAVFAGTATRVYRLDKATP
ncbi:MAG: amidohydrolase family protein [Acidimicrobiia bacterium]